MLLQTKLRNFTFSVIINQNYIVSVLMLLIKIWNEEFLVIEKQLKVNIYIYLWSMNTKCLKYQFIEIQHKYTNNRFWKKRVLGPSRYMRYVQLKTAFFIYIIISLLLQFSLLCLQKESFMASNAISQLNLIIS